MHMALCRAYLLGVHICHIRFLDVTLGWQCGRELIACAAMDHMVHENRPCNHGSYNRL